MPKLPQFRIDQYVSLVVVVLALLVSPIAPATAKPETTRRQIALSELADVPTFQIDQAQKKLFLDQVSATSIYVSDEASGAILLSKNANEQLYPASTTKIMTALISREIYPMTQVLTVGEGAFSEGNVMGLIPGEQISVNQLLHGLLIRSGNDAAFVLAANHPDGYKGFIAAMNQKAADLRLKQSSYSNPSGLDADGLLMSAHDLSILSREIFKDDVLYQIMKTKTDKATDTSGVIQHQLDHTHQLLYSDPTALAGKTGTTDAAGQVLVTLFERPDQSGSSRKVIVVVMGSQDRYTDTQKIINWVFENYHWQQVSL